MKLTVLLNDLNEVKNFVNITSQYADELQLSHDNYTVDAKSILGIFSMDLSQPVDLVCEKQNDQLKADLAKYVVA